MGCDREYKTDTMRRHAGRWSPTATVPPTAILARRQAAGKPMASCWLAATEVMTPRPMA